MGCFPYKGRTGDVLSIRERQVPTKKGDHECVLVTVILSQVDATYESSDRMTFRDTQEVVRLASKED